MGDSLTIAFELDYVTVFPSENDCSAGGSSNFFDILPLYQHVVDQLLPLLQTKHVTVVFFGNPCDGWIPHTWGVNPHILKFVEKRIQSDLIRNQMVSLCGQSVPYRLWNSLMDCGLSMNDRVLVVGTTRNAMLAFNDVIMDAALTLHRSGRLGGRLSFILLGESPEVEVICRIQSFACMTGGFVFPDINDHMSLSNAIDCLRIHFLVASKDELDERSRHVDTRRHSFPEIQIETTLKRLHRFAPSRSTREALLKDISSLDWRFTRGLRKFRELYRDIRDVTILDSGPIGLELSAPSKASELWSVASTRPPISGLGLEAGSVLVCINDNLVGPDTPASTIVRLMQQRPICCTFIPRRRLEFDEPRRAFIAAFSEELSSTVLVHRATNPYRAIPPPLFGRQLEPWHDFVKGDHCIVAKALIVTCNLMCDLEMFFQLRGLSRGINNLLRNNGKDSTGHHTLQYITRRGKSPEFIRGFVRMCTPRPFIGLQRVDVMMKCSYGISLAEIIDASTGLTDKDFPWMRGRGNSADFAFFIDVVTPACFSFNSSMTRLVKSEGVPLELMFTSLVVEASLCSPHDASVRGRLARIYCLEGFCSLFWIRLFLIIMSRIRLTPNEDVVTVSIEQLSFRNIDDTAIEEALDIPLGQEWVSQWTSNELC
jgi:hypothetical protein